MDYAVMDVGSNTMRLVIYRHEDGKLSQIISQKEVAGLVGYVKNEQMSPEGINKVCEVLRAFREIAVRFAEEGDIHVFATASLRGILNRDKVLEAIRLSCGLVPEVLTGEEEARLDFVGASRFLPRDSGLVIDIGGASTELVRFKGAQPKELVSVPIGCLSLYTRYVTKILPNDKERKKIKKAIKTYLDKVIQWNAGEKPPLMIGVGGTVRAAHKLACGFFLLPRDSGELKATHIKSMLEELKSGGSHIYHTLYKEIPDRVQTISAGLMILQEAMGYCRCESLLVSDFGVREGYLIDRVLKEDAADASRDRERGALHAESGAVVAEV